MFRSFSVNIPKIPKKEFDLRAYGAIGDGRTSNTEAFRKAMEAAAAEGGRVIVPNGIWLTGPIRLLSNTALHLEDNAVILFDKDPEDIPSFRNIELKNCICRDENARYVIQPMNGYPETIRDVRLIDCELGETT